MSVPALKTHWLGLWGLALLAVLLPACSPSRMIYYPQRYDRHYVRRLPPRTLELAYAMPFGRQVSFYIPPRRDPGRAPDQLWMLFCGNASSALDWLDLVLLARDDRAGFLLFDYPGFGRCEGNPSEPVIYASALTGLAELGRQLGQPPGWFEGRLNLMGHSLGSASALQLALEHDARRVILLAPFTTISDVARHLTGWPMDMFLSDRYDNTEKLASLTHKPGRPDLILIHGAKDSLVPVWMSRHLAAYDSAWIRYHELPACGHDDIIEKAEPLILSEMFTPED